MGRRYKKRETFFSKLVNWTFTLLIAGFLASMLSSASAHNLKFAQVSDAQYSSIEADTTYKVLKSSPQILDDVILQINNTPHLDFVMFSGDLVNKPKESQLLEFISRANCLNVPWYGLLGNHDVQEYKMSKEMFFDLLCGHNPAFSYKGPYYSFVPKKGFKVIVLDTIIRDRLTSNGFINDEQLKWLKTELDNSEKDTVLIFMHVPVIEPFASAGHRLLNANEVRTIIETHKNPIAVFQGHYHAAMIKQFDNVLYVSTPSLVSYPNAFRMISVSNHRKKVVVNIEFKETRLKNIQKLAKIMVFASKLYAGEEQDHSGTFEIVKN